ncbi:hypothetical protein EJ02DRAFT_418149 [Clathrospora elynae]|uniref:Uncharacterized protein n=1 Tax=Clathrospora elynae TaxID=706981 RepID=A0A6A5T3M5_9PLEO|nr:hypothetical protein EJ02DRAFT_418149 [Clathrospora elynae]
MSSTIRDPELDLEINAQNAMTKSANKSKIPNPPAAQWTDGTDRRNPFFVGANGEPRHTAISPPARSIVPPVGSSKLPRKSQTPIQLLPKSAGAPGSKRSSLPTRGGRSSLAPNTPTILALRKVSPSSSRDKPLPSPPIVQIVNPNSPPKAQRTLVDAEAGTPSEEEWPILRPENVSPATKTDVLQQRSVSDGAQPQQIANSFFGDKNSTTASLKDAGNIPIAPALMFQQASLRQQQFIRMTAPRPLSSNNPYNDPYNDLYNFHAISTATESAAESPLAYKSAPPRVIVPPRISSKRSSLPLPNQFKDNSLVLPKFPLPPNLGSGSTKWPIFVAQEHGEAETGATSVLSKQQIVNAASASSQHVSRPTDMGHAVSPERKSFDSVSAWSEAAGSSLNDEPERDYEGSTRIKRLSWQSSGSGSGPVLTIHTDADAVIYGQSSSIPDVPAIPDPVPDKSPQQRSLSDLTGRFSKQTMSRISLTIPSSSPSSNTTEMGPSGSPVVKISPIRSMRPPRKGSLETNSPQLSSPVSPTFPIPRKASEASLVSSTSNRNVSGASQQTATPAADLEPDSASLSTVPESPGRSGEAKTDSLNATSKLATAPNAETMRSIDEETPPPAIRNLSPTKWISSSFSTSKTKEADTTRCKTSESLESAARQSNRNSGSYANSSSSPSLPGTVRSQDAPRSVGPSKLRTSQTQSRGTPVSHQSGLQRSTPVSSSPLGDASMTQISVKHNGKTKEATAKKVKIKRSFRNLFPRRDNNRPRTPEIAERVQGFMSGTRSSLAKRIRDSKSLSKVYLPRMPESKSEKKLVNTAKQSPAAAALTTTDDRLTTSLSPKITASIPVQGALSVKMNDATTAITTIVDRVSTMSADSPDRLRGLEIAEVCRTLRIRHMMLDELILTVRIKQVVLRSLECCREAKISTEQARMHARNAELNTERSILELRRLQQLCGNDLDAKTAREIKRMVNHTITGNPEGEGVRKGPSTEK